MIKTLKKTAQIILQ